MKRTLLLIAYECDYDYGEEAEDSEDAEFEPFVDKEVDFGPFETLEEKMYKVFGNNIKSDAVNLFKARWDLGGLVVEVDCTGMTPAKIQKKIEKLIEDTVRRSPLKHTGIGALLVAVIGDQVPRAEWPVASHGCEAGDAKECALALLLNGKIPAQKVYEGHVRTEDIANFSG